MIEAFQLTIDGRLAEMAMLAAQNAYLQAMAGFQNPGMMGMGAPGGFMSPPFSPQPGYGGPGSQVPYAQSFMGMQPPQPPFAGSTMGHARRSSASQTPPHQQQQQYQQQQQGGDYFRQQ